jgi:ferritin-like metal-binding protein YciE
MTIETKREMFDRELQKLYHAELEILDLHGDLAAAAASPAITDIFEGHREDTVTQITRIETMFERLGHEPEERGSAIMEGLLAEKDEFVTEVADDDLRDLDAISIGMINERLELTLLDRLLLLAEALDLPEEIGTALNQNRTEAATALQRMQDVLEQRRSTSSDSTGHNF